jgi:dienelactone hydrolase
MSRLAETEAPEPPPPDEARLEEWREERRRRLDEILAPWPTAVALDLEIQDGEECGPYRRYRVVYDSEANMSVPAYLLVPTERRQPGPAVLAVHGHGPGKSQVCGLDGSEETDAAAGTAPVADADALGMLEDGEDPNADYGHQLACRGYVVLAPDLRCFGERLDWNPPDHYACDVNLVHAYIAGASPLTHNLWDLARSLDVLSGHELVDPRRIGMVGLSYGATVTLFLAAIDERVSAAVVSGYFSSWAEAHKMPWNMCGSQVLPGMLGAIEHVDLASLVAPRPLLVESGTSDLLFPAETAKQEIAGVARVYEALGAPDRLVHDVFDGGHRWHGELAYAFLDRWLRDVGVDRGAGASATV